MQNFYLLLRNGLLKIIILDVIFLWDKKLSPMIRGKSLTVMSLLFWLIVFFRKKVPAKGLDPASQALLSELYLLNHPQWSTPHHLQRHEENIHSLDVSTLSNHHPTWLPPISDLFCSLVCQKVLHMHLLN